MCEHAEYFVGMLGKYGEKRKGNEQGGRRRLNIECE
jgi:hypothetical protein